MTTEQIQIKIDANLDELNRVKSMTETEFLTDYSGIFDSMDELIDLVNEEILCLTDAFDAALEREEAEDMEYWQYPEEHYQDIDAEIRNQLKAG